MKKFLVVGILLALFLTPGWAWIKIYHTTNSEALYSVKPTSDGGYICAGFQTSLTAGSDVFLMKTDEWGDTVWTQSYGPKGDDVGQAVLETEDGGYIVVGQTDSAGTTPWDIYLIKTLPGGHLEWYRTYGGPFSEFAADIKKTRDGGYIIVGATNSSGAGGVDVYLVKIDASGTLSWNKTFGGSANDAGYSIQQTPDDGYIIAGATYSFGVQESDIYLIKTDSWGDTLWTKTFGAAGVDWGYCVRLTSDGGYVVIGQTNYFGAGGSDVYLIKTDSLGNEDWTKTFGGAQNDLGGSGLQTDDGGYVITGWTYSYGSGGCDAYLVKTDAAGQTKWTKTFGQSTTDDAGWWVEQTPDGGYIIAGWLQYPGTGDYDIYLIKTDSLGRAVAEETKPRPATRLQLSARSPCNQNLEVSFFLPVAHLIRLELYDATGSQVDLLADAEFDRGWHHLNQHTRLPAGIYFIKLSALGSSATTQKITVVR